MSYIKDIAADIEEEIECRTAEGTRMTAAEVNALTERLYAEAIAGGPSAQRISPAARHQHA